MNVIYDIPAPDSNDRRALDEVPVYDYVVINGKLTFATDIDIDFRAKRIFVRGGELILGTQQQPLTKEVSITLVGEQTDETLYLDNAYEGGNKILAVTNKLKAYGKPRDTMSRLTQTAE